MNKLSGELAAIIAALLLALGAAAPAAAAVEKRSDPDVTQLDISNGLNTGASATMTFDEPIDPVTLEREIEEAFGPITLSVNADGEATAVTQTAEGRIARVTSARTDFGTSAIHCNSMHRAADSNVIYTVQRQCGVQKAPWGLRQTPAMIAVCVGTVAELGMQYVTNGGPLQVNASHAEGCGYHFHGTFSGVAQGRSTNWYDQLGFRHNVGPGGSILIEVYGTHRWLSAA